MEETAMVTDLREICEQFSDDHIKVKIDICATNLPNKIKVKGRNIMLKLILRRQF